LARRHVTALDITEVYSRIFIVGAPSRLPTSRDASRNNVDDLANCAAHWGGVCAAPTAAH